MDPNVWNHLSQFYGLPQTFSTSGLSLLEQAALSTGINNYGVGTSQTLQEPSVYKGAPVAPPQQSPVLPQTLASSRLPPVANITQKAYGTEYMREAQGTSSLASLVDNTKWNLTTFVPDMKLGDPPPAHSGSKSSSHQAPHRPRADYQQTGDQNAIIELLKQQQQLQSDPPKAHQQSSKYLDHYQVSDKYSSLAHKYQEPSLQKYQETTQQKYVQDTMHKYQESLGSKYIDPSQKYKQYQDPLQKYKTEYQSTSDRYQQQQQQEDTPSSSQLHRMLRNQQLSNSRSATAAAPSQSYTEPSPPSHDSSPHMGHNSPQLSHNSPQMSQGGHIQHAVYSTYSNAGSSSSSYIMSNAPSVYAGSNETASNMYEAISPAAATSSATTYQTVNLDGLSNLSGQTGTKIPLHAGQQQQAQMQIPSPPAMGAQSYDQQPSPMSVASPTSTVQTPAQTIRAQADSTTKSKRGRTRGGSRGGRGGGGGVGGRGDANSKAGGGSRSKKKEDDSDIRSQHSEDNLPLHMQHSSHQQHMIAPPQLGMMTTLSMSSHVDNITGMNMQPGLEQMAQGYGVAEYNDEAMLQIQMAQGLLGMGESAAMRAEQEAILMMNSGGHQYNDDNEGHVMQEMKTENEMKHENTVEDNVGLGLATVEHKPVRSKAAMKQRPQDDEEFSHLAPTEVSGAMNQQSMVSPEPPKPKPIIKNDGSFQSSYLSFLQGNKQETLSSVTNSSITNKPELPKYIPEPPRPKPKPKPPSPAKKDLSTDMKLKTETVTFSDDEESSQGSSSVQQINKTVQGVISNLSDDLGSNKGGAGNSKKSSLIGNKTILTDKQKLQALAAEKQRLQLQAAERQRAAIEKQRLKQAEQQRKPLTLKIKMSDIKMPSDSSKPKSPSKKLKSPSSSGASLTSPGTGRGQSRGKVKSASRKKSVDSELQSENENGTAASTPKTSRENSPLPQRQRAARKAKDRVEEKRKARNEKKSKKKRKKSSKSSSHAVDSDASNYSSDDLYLDSGSEKDYDSDKDPVWIPGEKNALPELDETDEANRVRMSQQRMGKLPRSGGKTGHSRRRRTISEDEEWDEPLIPSKKSKSTSGGSAPINTGNSGGSTTVSKKNVVIEECDSDDNSPHQYMKGDFVMEKKEMCNPDKYVIWKIDAGKLIQKFEPFMLDGKLLHKSLSTYSSWSDFFKPNYLGIQVNTMSSIKNQEVVEVQQNYKPKHPDDLLEKDESMEHFNVYVQILVSLALEPGFLSLVKQQKNTEDDYYTAPLEKIEKLLIKRKEEISEAVKWTLSFKEIIDKYPLLRIAEKYSVDDGVHCQASLVSSEKLAKKVARIYGEPYENDTLEKVETGQLPVDKAIEFHIGDLASKYLRQYHRIHHFKVRMYKKCLYMVDCCRRAGGKDMNELLDQCLQNRVWVQNLFREFKKLLETDKEAAAAAAAEEETENRRETTETLTTADENTSSETATATSVTESAQHEATDSAMVADTSYGDSVPQEVEPHQQQQCIQDTEYDSTTDPMYSNTTAESGGSNPSAVHYNSSRSSVMLQQQSYNNSLSPGAASSQQQHSYNPANQEQHHHQQQIYDANLSSYNTNNQPTSTLPLSHHPQHAAANHLNHQQQQPANHIMQQQPSLGFMDSNFGTGESMVDDPSLIYNSGQHNMPQL